MILVTGPTGFVGSALIHRLLMDKGSSNVLAAVRCSDRERRWPKGVNTVQVGDLMPVTDWHAVLQGVSEIVHLAARVHIMNDKSPNTLAEFRHVNVAATANLARQAAAAGVRRFIYLSSIKVNGESTAVGRPFKAVDMPAPEDPYGVSKHEAEQLLRLIAAESGMEVVIIRPPLVYGPGVKANFASMMRWLARGVPLPLAGITENRRSLVALDNLVDLIVTCLKHPAAADQTFLVSDGEDLSTAALLRRIGNAQGIPARLFHAPVATLRLGAALLGKQSIYHRLCGSLQVDIRKTQELLGWTPPVSVDEGLRRMAEGFRA